MYDHYQGKELDIFAKAVNWKKYFSALIAPYLNGNILEIGAGQGGTTEALINNTIKINHWVCLEPDEILYGKLLSFIKKKHFNIPLKALNGTIDDIKEQNFNSILYIDVIEHINKPEEELAKAVDCLSRNGYLILLIPAHNFLYSPFDKSIGHFKRYNKSSINKIIPDNLRYTKTEYLDSIGFLASLANKFFLKQTIPTEKQILFWDNKMIKVSKFTDKILRYSFGKTLLSIWQKN